MEELPHMEFGVAELSVVGKSMDDEGDEDDDDDEESPTTTTMAGAFFSQRGEEVNVNVVGQR